MKKVYCAGIIVISYAERKILVIQHPEGHWGFPKGHIEFGESKLEAAIRELREETGVTINFFLNTKKYSFNMRYICMENGEMIEKEIVFYLGVTCNVHVDLAEHLKGYKWITSDDMETLELQEQYKQIIISLERIIHKSFCIKSCSEINIENLELLNNIGSKHEYSRIAPLKVLYDNLKITGEPNILDTYFLNTLIDSNSLDEKGYFVISEDDITKCWSVINLLPTLIYKHKKVIMKGKPCGCNIGKRPIDLYLSIMENFGIKILKEQDGYKFEYEGVNKDVFIDFPFPSFSGTSIAIYLAIVSDVTTYISNVSIEPEILYLLNVLERMGHCISFEERTRKVIIKGNSKLIIKETNIDIPEDRNILITRIICRLMQKKSMHYVSRINQDLEVLEKFFHEIGIKCFIERNVIIINNFDGLIRSDISSEFGFYPLLCSDWQPLIALLLMKYSNNIKIYDRVFEGRYGYIEQLNEFLDGFKYFFDNNHLEITREKELILKETTSLNLKCLDIRASATLFIALNSFECRKFKITNLDQFFRGYSSISNFSKEFETRCFYDFDYE